MKRFITLALASLLPFMAQAETPVTIATNYGDIELVLDETQAPITVANFVAYAQSGFYDGTIFHRVIPGFMIQGGGFNADMSQKKTQATIENEAKNGLSNVTGSIAMARTNSPHSASSQFFINHADNLFLDQQGDKWGYAVFGKVVSGMDVINSIAQVSTGRKGPYSDVPTAPIVINSVTVH
jgi:cyclophilin family peptidyl-prolyl cis-trans isomerase